MSDENIEVVRLAYDVAYAQRSVEGVRNRFSPDFVFHNRPEFPGRQLYRMEEIEQLWADLDDTYSDFSLVPIEFADVGDYVIVTLRSSAQLQGSEARVEGTIWHVWRVADGRPQEGWAFGSRNEALLAVRRESTMSRENVEIGLRYTAAINARKVPEHLLAPEFRVETVNTAVTEGTYHGAEGLRQWIVDFFDVLGEDGRYEVQPLEVGDDYVLSRVNIVGSGAVSGAPLALCHYGVIWIRNGKITRAVGYPTREEALEAVGLSE